MRSGLLAAIFLLTLRNEPPLAFPDGKVELTNQCFALRMIAGSGSLLFLQVSSECIMRFSRPKALSLK